MKRLLFILIMTVASSGWCQSVPFSFDAPKDWRSERIPFPLSFAPNIKHKGFEELRFAPGMFKPKSDTYFSYAFLMWLEGQPEFNTKQIESDLFEYYRGLCAVVAKQRKIELDLSKISVKVTDLHHKAKKLGHSSRSFDAVVHCYDAFVTGKELTLQFQISVWYCSQSERTVLLAIVSPQPKTAAVWKQLYEVKHTFTCHRLK